MELMEISHEFKPSELGDIPEDWSCKTIGELFHDGIIEKPMDGNHGNIHPTSGDFVAFGIPFVMSNNVQNGKVDLQECSFITKQQADSLQKGFSIAGDVLLTHKATIGNTAIVGDIAWDYIMLTPQVTYYRIADSSQLCNRYLRHFFDSCAFQTVLEVLAGGGTRSYIGIVAQHALPVALPPTLAEQEAIAEALGDADALIESLEQLIAKKRQIKQGAMQQLLTGKTRLPGFAKSAETKPTEVGEIPVDWTVTCLGTLTDKVGSGITPTGGSSVYQQSGRPFVRSQNIGWGNLRLNDLAFIGEATHASFDASEICEEDVLLNITGASIGRSAVADSRIAGGNVNQHVCIIRSPRQKLVPKYLNYTLLSDTGQRQIDSFQAGGNREGLNFGQIRSFDIPLPDAPEQEQIAAVLSDMDTELSALEAKLAKYGQIKQGMMHNLLTGRIRLV